MAVGKKWSAGCCPNNTFCNALKRILLSNLKLILLITGICCGVAMAFGMRAADIHRNPRKVAYVSFLGELFLSMLKSIIIPLMISAIVSGLASMESAASGQIGLRSVIFYLTTVFIAVCVGIGMVSAIRPGHYGTPPDNDDSHKAGTGRVAMTADTIMDLIRNMFPPNIVQACIQQYQTHLLPPPNKVLAVVSNVTNRSTTTTTTPASTTFILMFNDTNTTAQGHYVVHDYSDWIITRRVVEGTNILGIVVFSLVCGVAISRLGVHGKPLADLFRALNQVVMLAVDWIMWLAPIGVCFLVAGQLLKVKDFGSMFAQLGMYMVTVLSGLAIHAFAVLPLICFVFTRKNPYPIIHGGSRAYATGFGTASSAATLPITIECCEVKNKVDPRICRFTLPIATAINLDGTALYEAVAAIFIAQTENVPLDFGKIVAVSVTATAAAVGAAGIPEAGLVTLVMVLDAVGLPAEFIGTILAVDWLLDRFRTVVNILGDVIGASVIEHLCRGALRSMDEREARERVEEEMLAEEAGTADMHNPAFASAFSLHPLPALQPASLPAPEADPEDVVAHRSPLVHRINMPLNRRRSAPSTPPPRYIQ